MRPRIWRIPLALGVASLAGLISALVGDGVWDGVSWVGLGAPVAVAAACLLRRDRRA